MRAALVFTRLDLGLLLTRRGGTGSQTGKTDQKQDRRSRPDRE
jgi:hypothetical protein